MSVLEQILKQLKKLDQLNVDDDGRNLRAQSRSPEPTEGSSSLIPANHNNTTTKKLASKKRKSQSPPPTEAMSATANQSTTTTTNQNTSHNTSHSSQTTSLTGNQRTAQATNNDEQPPVDAANLPSTANVASPRDDSTPNPEIREVFIDTMWYVIVKHKQRADGTREEYRRTSLQAAKKEAPSRKYNPSQKLVRLVLAYAIKNKFKACQLDIDLAFTDVDFVDENVQYFIDDPKYGIDNTRTTFTMHKLKRPLPGIKGAQKLFYGGFTMFLVNKLNFKEFSGAKGVWVYAPKQKTKVIVMIEGDDILIFGETDEDVDWIVSEFESQYKVAHLGYPLLFVGNNINYNLEQGTVTMDRGNRTVHFLDKIGLRPDRSILSIMDSDFDTQWREVGSRQRLPRAEKGLKTIIYQQILAELVALSKSVRSGIAKEVSTFASLELYVNDWLIAAIQRAIKFTANYNIGWKYKGESTADDEFTTGLVIQVSDEDRQKATISYFARKDGGVLDWWSKVVYQHELDLLTLQEQALLTAKEDFKHLKKLDHFIHTGEVLENVEDCEVAGCLMMDGQARPFGVYRQNL